MPPRGLPVSRSEVLRSSWASARARLEPGGGLREAVLPALPPAAPGEACPLRAWMRAHRSAIKLPEPGEST